MVVYQLLDQFYEKDHRARISRMSRYVFNNYYMEKPCY
jgi:hypothetical protein